MIRKPLQIAGNTEYLNLISNNTAMAVAPAKYTINMWSCNNNKKNY